MKFSDSHSLHLKAEHPDDRVDITIYDGFDNPDTLSWHMKTSGQAFPDWTIFGTAKLFRQMAEDILKELERLGL